jgi:hypothetical protein
MYNYLYYKPKAVLIRPFFTIIFRKELTKTAMELKKWIFVILSIVVLMIAGVICITSRAVPGVTLPEPIPVKTIPQNNTPKQIPFVCIDIPEIIEPETPVKRPVIPELYGPLDNTQNIFDQPILGGYFLNSETNASVAAQSLNGYVIQPGTVFSFNNAVGERTPEKGYVEGWVVSGNTYKKEIGGGVCRASTALYNAALSAGLKIIESAPHTMPVGYASRGQDAAVYYSVLDLKFQNNLDSPVVVKTLEQNGKLFFALVKEISKEVPEDVPKTNVENNTESPNHLSISEEEQEEPEREGFIYW